MSICFCVCWNIALVYELRSDGESNWFCDGDEEPFMTEDIGAYEVLADMLMYMVVYGLICCEERCVQLKVIQGYKKCVWEDFICLGFLNGCLCADGFLDKETRD